MHICLRKIVELIFGHNQQTYRQHSGICMLKIRNGPQNPNCILLHFCSPFCFKRFKTPGVRRVVKSY